MTVGLVASRLRKAERRMREKGVYSAPCICFPPKEPPTFVWQIMQDIALQVKCPLHGQRFTPWAVGFMAGWLIEKQEKMLMTSHSEQFRKAWFASFPPDLWSPTPQVVCKDDEFFLMLKDGTLLSDDRFLRELTRQRREEVANAIASVTGSN